MKTLIVLGILLVGAGVTIATDSDISATWMSTTGIIFLLGALAVSKKAKVLTYFAVFLMAVLFLGGLVGGMWYAHPLGAILNIVAGIWVAYKLIKDKREEGGETTIVASSNLFTKLLLVIKQNSKWLVVPASVLFVLWITKSVLVAFVLSFGVLTYFDRQSIKDKGLNRIAVLLLLYAVVFALLIISLFKITNPYDGVFYNLGDAFFDKGSYLFNQLLNITY